MRSRLDPLTSFVNGTRTGVVKKYCNCAKCGSEIETLWSIEGQRITEGPTRVGGRPLCDMCIDRHNPGDKPPTYSHTLKLMHGPRN